VLVILLLIVYLFNMAGYFFLFGYFIGQSDKQLVQQIDNNQYSNGELIEIKLALHLPYITGSTDYERADGEVELNGIYYNYVKRRVDNDTLYLVCLPNKSKTTLYTARTDYARQANDIPSGEKNGRALAKKISIVNEYDQQITGHYFASPAISIQQQIVCSATRPANPFIDDNYRPPQANSAGYFSL